MYNRVIKKLEEKIIYVENIPGIFYDFSLFFVQLLPSVLQSTKYKVQLIPKSHPLTDPNQKCPRTQRIEL